VMQEQVQVPLHDEVTQLLHDEVLRVMENIEEVRKCEKIVLKIRQFKHDLKSDLIAKLRCGVEDWVQLDGVIQEKVTCFYGINDVSGIDLRLKQWMQNHDKNLFCQVLRRNDAYEKSTCSIDIAARKCFNVRVQQKVSEFLPSDIKDIVFSFFPLYHQELNDLELVTKFACEDEAKLQEVHNERENHRNNILHLMEAKQWQDFSAHGYKFEKQVSQKGNTITYDTLDAYIATIQNDQPTQSFESFCSSRPFESMAYLKVTKRPHI